jgi:Domain of unknown function (DUF4221)
LSLKNKVWSSIPIGYGPYGETLRGYCLTAQNDMILIYQDVIAMADSIGKLKHFHQFANPIAQKERNVFILSDVSNHILPWKDQIFISQISMDYNNWQQEYYDVPILSRYSFLDSSFSDVPIYYPKSMQKNIFGETMAFWCAINNNNQIVVSYEGSPIVSVYDIAKNITNEFTIKSSYDNQEKQIFDPKFKDDFNIILDYKLENPVYGEILFDQYLNCYYRYFSPGIPLKKQDGGFASFLDRTYYLMILDMELNILDEIQLEKNLYPSISFVTRDGLFIKVITDSTYDQNNYSYFKVYTRSVADVYMH